MDNIGAKQKYLIQKVKKYFNRLSNLDIDISKSSFCYIPSFGLNPGNTKLIKWIDNKLLNLENIKIIFFHILAISSYYNYKIYNGNQKNYKSLFISWGKKKDFKNNNFSDKLLNANSESHKKSLFFVIYLDEVKPSIIPKNVILFYKKKRGRSIFFLLKILTQSLFIYQFNLRKFIHYVSSQTIFAEKIYDKIDSVVKKNNIQKIIMPYEGQPFQNFVMSKLDKKIKTHGIVHSILPALPTNLVKRKGSPQKIYVSSQEQKKVLIKFLGWNKSEIVVIDSLRFKKKIDKGISGSIFLPINIKNVNKIINDFDIFSKSQNLILISKLKVRNHPAMNNSPIHKNLIKEINNLITKKNLKFKGKFKKNICIFIGPTSAVIELLDKKFKVFHIPINPILDIYNNNIFSSLETKKKYNSYIYKRTNKKNMIQFGSDNYNFKSLQIV